MPETSLDPLFYVNVGTEGTFKKTGDYHSTPANVDAIFKHLSDNDIQTLVLYFHGGLVSEKSGMGSATTMKGAFHDVVAKRHVVSFVWETGPLEVLRQNLDTFIRQDLIKTILMKVIKLAAKKLDVPLGDRGMGGYLSDADIEKELQKIEPFANDARQLAVVSRGGGFDVATVSDARLQNSLEIEAGIVFNFEEKRQLEVMDFTSVKFLKDEHQDINSSEDKGGAIALIKAIAWVSFKVIKRYINKTHHDFYPTVMEEILREFYVGGLGEWGWTAIKNKARDMFLPISTQTGDDQYAGEYFLVKLKQHLTTPVGKSLKLHLIGHSAGSIAISHLMEAVKIRHNSIVFEQLFFLAPACRVDLFQQHVEPAIGKSILSFRMFTMREENEKKDHCVPVVYTHSLLYLVSGLFEKDDIDAKIMGLNEQFRAEGRYDNFNELKQLKSFLAGSPNRLVLSDDTSDPNLKFHSTALKHGDFDNDDVTLTAIKSTL